MSDTSELDKMHAVKDRSQAIGEFLDWLEQDGIMLCKWHERNDEDESDYSGYMNVHESIEKMLARYFEIDLNKVEEEKRKILDELRKQNG